MARSLADEMQAIHRTDARISKADDFSRDYLWLRMIPFMAVMAWRKVHGFRTGSNPTNPAAVLKFMPI